eukprot:6189215-Pleurochrysis_carterae.AAC.1
MACDHVGLSSPCAFSSIATLTSASLSLPSVKMSFSAFSCQSFSPAPPASRTAAAEGNSATMAMARAAFISAGYDCAARVR